MGNDIPHHTVEFSKKFENRRY